MDEFEYKIWYIDKISSLIGQQINELNSSENLFMEKFFNPKIELIQNLRNTIVGVSAFAVASLIGLLSVDQPAYLKDNVNSIMILLFIGIGGGVSSFAILALVKHGYLNKIQIINLAYRKSRSQCIYLQGVLAASTDYLQNLSIYELLLFR